MFGIEQEKNMKKITFIMVLALVLGSSSLALAHPGSRGGYHHNGGHYRSYGGSHHHGYRGHGHYMYHPGRNWGTGYYYVPFPGHPPVYIQQKPFYRGCWW
jgi:hypothetical protein